MSLLGIRGPLRLSPSEAVKELKVRLPLSGNPVIYQGQFLVMKKALSNLNSHGLYRIIGLVRSHHKYQQHQKKQVQTSLCNSDLDATALESYKTLGPRQGEPRQPDKPKRRPNSPY